MSRIAVIAAYGLKESLRRRVFLVVLLLTVAFLAMYALAVAYAFDETERLAAGTEDLVDDKALTGGTMLGLAMFTTLFLGAVLAVFLTLNAVRGDVERGLLQPLVVRPVSRTALLLARFLAAAGVCGGYALAVYAAAVAITGAAGDWWPDRVVGPGLGLASGVVILVALSILGSVFLSATANGIAVFMVFGAGLTAGLVGQIGEALDSKTLDDIAEVAAWLLPFEALYQAGLHGLTADTGGFTRIAVNLGPFGGSEQGGDWLPLWALAYLVLVLAAARAAFVRRDL